MHQALPTGLGVKSSARAVTGTVLPFFGGGRAGQILLLATS